MTMVRRDWPAGVLDADYRLALVASARLKVILSLCLSSGLALVVGVVLGSVTWVIMASFTPSCVFFLLHASFFSPCLLGTLISF